MQILPPPNPRSRFQLLRYVVLMSLTAIVVFAPLMYLTKYLEEMFFADVQQEQLSYFGEVQTDFMREHDLTREGEMLKVHEAGHVNLAHVFANMLWEETFMPFVKRAQLVPIDHCRELVGSQGTADTAALSPGVQSCFDNVRQAIMAMPRFAEIDARVRAMMRKSSVFKVKVFDLRGLTLYCSEHAQIGEDKSGNQGWKTAAGGHVASELTHRTRFSAFEGVVENRDLISSYIPILTTDNRVQGVFEIYSDATPFLKASTDASLAMARRIAENRATAEWVARKNQERINQNNDYAQAITVGLFALFYAVLLLIVVNAQRILDRQALAQEQANERERSRYREKMTALATLAANVSHEVGNPLAAISALAEDIDSERKLRSCPSCQPAMILQQTERIMTMTRQLVSFASVRDQESEAVDVNQMVVAICDFLGFDHRFRAVRIDTRLADQLPVQVLIPDHLNETLMILLQDCLQKNLQRPDSPRRILVETQAHEGGVLIRVNFDGSADIPGVVSEFKSEDYLDAFAHQRLLDMGGSLAATQTMIEVRLSASSPANNGHNG